MLLLLTALALVACANAIPAQLRAIHEVAKTGDFIGDISELILDIFANQLAL
jgi:hypothetical protein